MRSGACRTAPDPAPTPKGEVLIRPVILVFLAAAVLAALLSARLSRNPLPASGSANVLQTREQLTATYPGAYFYRGPRGTKKAALTFDDGPDDKLTPQILDILKENRVPGTFFLIGENALAYPDLVRRMVREGHVIGNHSWSHPNMLYVDPRQARQEIGKTREVLERITRRRTILFRAPRGKISTGVMDLAIKEGLRVIGWSVDSFDWRDPESARIFTRLSAEVHPGAIILMHAVVLPNSRGVTVRVLPALIKELKAQGYQLVTVDELLRIPAYGPPRPAEDGATRSVFPGKHRVAAGPIALRNRPISRSPYTF